MEYTYSWYLEVLKELKKEEYVLSNYSDWKKSSKSVIVRHDIDMDLQAAVDLAKVENEFWQGANKAVYFVLISTEFYSVFTKKSKEKLKKIMELGGEIGLHFDETQYDECTTDNLCRLIENEKKILESVVECKVNVVSMHRPSKRLLEEKITVEGAENVYDGLYFKDMKYVSDSRRNWRENVQETIKSGKYSRLHILTHPIWYREREYSFKETMVNRMVAGVKNYENSIYENVTNLSEIVTREELRRLIIELL